MPNFLNRILHPFQKSSKRISADDFFDTVLAQGSLSATGVSVSPDKALRASAVYGCVRVLAETIASLPLFLYRRNGDRKEKAVEHPLYNLLRSKPNHHQTMYEFYEFLMAMLNLRGNSFVLKEFDKLNRIQNLMPLDPSRMLVKKNGMDISYEYTWEDGHLQQYGMDEIWHIKGLSTDGIIGLSPITVAREAIGLSLATEEHGARLFSNDARPGGVLEHPGTLTEGASARLKKSWQSAHAGGANAHKVAILEEGLKWSSIGFSNEDSQFLETRNYQVEDIARIFRVPAILIGHPGKTMTFASAEQFFLSFVTHTVRPWVVRIEQSINKHIVAEEDHGIYFAEFKIDGLLRGDIKSRYEAYAIAVQNKWMNSNEVRALENMNPREDGDAFENPNITAKAEEDKEMMTVNERRAAIGLPDITGGDAIYLPSSQIPAIEEEEPEGEK